MDERARVASALATELKAAKLDVERRLTAAIKKYQGLEVRFETEIARANALDEKRKAQTKELRALRREMARAFVLLVRDNELLEWLASLHAPAVAEDLGTLIVTIGSGPWPESTFDATLTAVGFTPAQFDPDRSGFEIVVVGQMDVDVDALAASIQRQLDDRVSVRLYSQELLLLYLMSGVDPLTMPETLLSKVFGQDHPTLSAFIEPPLQWPSLVAAKSKRGADPPPPERGSSPLHAFGYQAGRRTSDVNRRESLRGFYECPRLAPYFDEHEHDDEYKASWGRAKSVRRLQRMASHISWLIKFQGASTSKSKAKTDWTRDLAWLRETLR